MKRKNIILSIFGVVALLSASVFSVFAHNGMDHSTGMQHDSNAQMFNTNLTTMNNSGARGTASVMVNDNKVTVTINSTGLTPGLPHAQHLHIGGQNTCPNMSADDDGDGLVNTVEGHPFYGSIEVSLTTTGDVSPESKLAVDRMPVANDQGEVNYQRTFDLPEGVTADELSRAVVVQHGIGELFDNDLKFDGEPKSLLNPALPLEATIPTTCGALSSEGVGGGPGMVMMPEGAPNTGFGGMMN